ncbi:MAG: molybdopterin converting factor subunit 1 [Rhodospirillales bacterium]|nr:molybdopterin converting factor subunit 1 [Rhodospirillales bacterium]
MKVLYFAWLRSKTGVAEELLTPPESVGTVQELIDWLIERGAGYADAFADLSLVRVAVNQEYVDFSHPVKVGDEVAMFPPVTGG